MIMKWTCLLLLLPLTSACSEQEWETHPMLCRYLHWRDEDVDSLADHMHEWAQHHGLLVDVPNRLTSSPTTPANYPIVLAHGMGDSCYNDGFSRLVHYISQYRGVAAQCIPGGDTQGEDTSNGYFLSMDAHVDNFAEKVRADPTLTGGFYAMGLSQGNAVIRGYIARYNDPPVVGFISINGVNAGTGAVPHCFPGTSNLELTSWCDLLREQATRRAYSDFAQSHSFQANYWRDPHHYDDYLKYAQLAVYNNEGSTKNATLASNWSRTTTFVWVEALRDSMVWPPEGEQWAQATIDGHVVPREEAPWMVEDWFGLGQAEREGKNHYESFDGDHLQFSSDDLDRWLDTYFV